MAVDVQAFRRAAGSLATGVTIITSAVEGRSRGMTASAVCSLSLQPTYMLACLDKSASTLTLIRESGLFNINVLAAEQEPLAREFATKSLARESLSDEALCGRTNRGLPLIRGTAAWFECRVAGELNGGDHVILLGEVLAADADASKAPLTYCRGRYGGFQQRTGMQPV